MTDKLIMAGLIVIGVIHLLPLSGVIGGERIAQLYGVDAAEPNLALLLRHRAVLFGLLGGYFVAAAFLPSLRVSAFVMAGVSVFSFFYLAWDAGDITSELRRVVFADIVAVVALVSAVAAYFLQRGASR